MTERVLGALGVRPDEVSRIGPAATFALLAVAVQGLSLTAGDALFVSTFDLGQLSRFFVVSALVRVAGAFGYAALARRGGRKLDAGVVLGAAALLAVSGLLSGMRTPAVVWAVCVLQVALPPLLPLIAFNVALDCFDARQAKRLVPLVAAAATIGQIVAGALAGLLAPRVGLSSLFFAGAALALMGVPLPGWLSRHKLEGGAPAKAVAKSASTWRATLGDVADVPVVRLFVLNAAAAAALTSVVDFAFKASLKASLGREQMAAFLGVFTMASEALVLVLQLSLVGRIVSRLGLASSLRTMPITILAVAPIGVLLPGIVAATGTKLVEATLRFALTGSALELLLGPAPADVRSRAKVAVKGAAQPIGVFLAGATLGAFGAAGPPRWALTSLILFVALLQLLALARAKSAYTSALAQAVEAGRTFDVDPKAMALWRAQVARELATAVEERRYDRATQLLGAMTDAPFSVEDLQPALRAPAEPLRTAAIRAALRLAGPGDGERLLAAIPPQDDDALEAGVLTAARERGAVADAARLDRALSRSETHDGLPALFAEALVGKAATERDKAVKRLRKESLLEGSPRQAAALDALGELVEKRAEREILKALASEHPETFRAAARAAVRIGAMGAVPTLVARLLTGPDAQGVAKALVLAGPSAVDELLAALPTTRGEASRLRTAVADAGTVAGTVRAARVLALLGRQGCEKVLARFGDLGFRARDAVASAFAATSRRHGLGVERDLVFGAIDLTLSYGETLALAAPHAKPGGLLAPEIAHRRRRTVDRVLDLAAVASSSPLVEKARAALARDARTRANAIELLEQILPPAFARRTVSLIETSPTAGSARRPALDGWLAKCAAFDEGTLSCGEPMLPVLEKLLLLREASLFTGLSNEELYPVGEIAEEVSIAAGDAVVRQGEPGDALYVVAAGKLEAVRGDVVLRGFGRGEAFGEMSLLDGSPRAATVRAVTEAKVLRIPRAEFDALLDQCPEVARGVIRTLVAHLRAGEAKPSGAPNEERRDG